jgi:hypothetical protein
MAKNFLTPFHPSDLLTKRNQTTASRASISNMSSFTITNVAAITDFSTRNSRGVILPTSPSLQTLWSLTDPTAVDDGTTGSLKPITLLYPPNLSTVILQIAVSFTYDFQGPATQEYQVIGYAPDQTDPSIHTLPFTPTSNVMTVGGFRLVDSKVVGPPVLPLPFIPFRYAGDWNWGIMKVGSDTGQSLPSPPQDSIPLSKKERII